MSIGLDPDQDRRSIGPDLGHNSKCKGYLQTTKVAASCWKELITLCNINNKINAMKQVAAIRVPTIKTNGSTQGVWYSICVEQSANKQAYIYSVGLELAIDPPPPRGNFIQYDFLILHYIRHKIKDVSPLRVAALTCNIMLYTLLPPPPKKNSIKRP